jgi:hypothetical protein
LTATVTGASTISIEETDAITLTNIDSVSGQVNIAATAGNITITANGGVTTTGGNVNINSSAGGILTTAASDATADIVTATGTITLESAGGILDSGAGALDIDSGGGAVTLTGDGAGNILVDYESADADAVTLTVSHTNTGNATYDSLSTGTLTVAASSINNGNLEVHNDAGITASGQLDTSTTNGNLTLEALTGAINLDAVDDILTAGAGDITVTATAGSITIDDATANDEIVNTGTVTLTGAAIGATNALDLNGATALVISDLDGAGNHIQIDEQTASTIADTTITVATATSGTIDIDYFGTDAVDIDNAHALTSIVLSDGGNFSYTSIAGDIVATSVNTGAGDLTINSAGSISGDGAAAVDLVTSGATTLTAGGNIGTGDATADTAIDTTIAGLTATVTGGSTISIHETDAITLTEIDSASGQVNIAATAGNVVITAADASGAGGFNIDGASAIDVDHIQSAGGLIDLETTGAASVIDVGLNSILNTTGNVIVTASGANGTITLADGIEKITASGADADVTLSAGATIAVTGGADNDVDIDTGGTVSLTADAITAVDVEALDTLTISDTGAGAISVDELTASTITATNITVADATSGTIDIVYFGTDAVDIDNAHALASIVLSDGGSFSYTSIAGDIVATFVNTGAGDLTIDSAGDIHGLTDDATADVAGATINLTAAVGGIHGPTGTDALDVTASTALNADTTADGANIRIDSIGDLPVGLVDAWDDAGTPAPGDDTWGDVYLTSTQTA